MDIVLNLRRDPDVRPDLREERGDLIGGAHHGGGQPAGHPAQRTGLRLGNGEALIEIKSVQRAILRKQVQVLTAHGLAQFLAGNACQEKRVFGGMFCGVV